MTDFASLVTSEHNRRPNFMAVIEALTRPLQDCITTLEEMPAKFNLDTAVGDQLDAVGRWVGLSRLLTVPIGQDFFSFDVVGKGWNEASWKQPFTSSVGISSLDDDLYRLALRTKVSKNYWQGTVEELTVIMANALAEVGILVKPVDNFDMSMTMHIFGTLTDQQRELITRGYITPKPMGVRITNNEVGGDGYLWFALDNVTAGLDQGILK